MNKNASSAKSKIEIKKIPISLKQKGTIFLTKKLILVKT